jgi:hypothetical protein
MPDSLLPSGLADADGDFTHAGITGRRGTNGRYLRILDS